jgi:Glycosyltransferase family 10 (fucosyltransferase) C-term/Fucosyltransferase, N-terminal
MPGELERRAVATVMTAPVLGLYNRFFERWPVPTEIGAAEVSFRYGPEDSAAADAVVFHLPTLDALPERSDRAAGGGRRPQLWVAWCLESAVVCPMLADPEAMARFDLTMTYQRSSDIWWPYFGPGTVPHLLTPPGVKDAGAPVLHLQSNPFDRSGRNRFAAELMRRVKVDSYGAFLRNRSEQVAPGHAGRVAIMARYKFTLALENSIAADYVSDKFFDALTAGSVPVYRGAPEVAELAPAPGSYIDAADFASPAALAARLDRLSGDDAAYGGYHAWRTGGFSAAFRAHLRRLERPPFARLAERVRAWIAAGRPAAHRPE